MLLDGAMSNNAPRYTLLIVEDEPGYLDVLSELLAEEYLVITASDGQAALDIIAEKTVDLILSDVLMPKMNGLELCQAVKSDSRFRHIPFIMLSALDDIDSEIKGYNSQADDYLAKPISSELLKLKLRSWIVSHERHSQKIKENMIMPAERAKTNGVRENEFLLKLYEVLAELHADKELRVSDIAARLAMDQRTLRRRLEKWLGLSPNEVLRNYRLEIAHNMIKRGRNITETYVDTGFSSGSYFAKCFKERYGYTPKQLKEKKSK
jgi:YesN/AraC family two-component response regulator